MKRIVILFVPLLVLSSTKYHINKIKFLRLFLFIISITCKAQTTFTPEDYITKYKDDAIKEMYLNKVPACITLAQGMLESGNGNSLLCVNANNHFGIKCHKEWGGETYIMTDDEENECFRKYNNVLESYSDHSMFLFSRSRYAPLFELAINDYKGWCYGLKQAGYATDPKYAERLITLIEHYKLQDLNVIESTPKQLVSNPAPIKSELLIRQVYRFNRIRFVIAKENDSYYKIAHDFNIELDELLTFNDLSKTDKLQYGQKIYIEKKRRKALEPYHVVQKNETLKGISQLHGIRLSMLCKKNKLKSEDKLKIGDILYLRQRKV
jgi:LysM repeat protein